MKVKFTHFEKLRALKGFELLGEKEAQCILSPIRKLAICLFKIYRSKRNRTNENIIENQQVVAQKLQKVRLKTLNQLTELKHAA